MDGRILPCAQALAVPVYAPAGGQSVVSPARLRAYICVALHTDKTAAFGIAGVCAGGPATGRPNVVSPTRFDGAVCGCGCVVVGLGLHTRV